MLINPPLHSKLLSEFVGVFALCAIGIGTILHVNEAGAAGLLAVALAHGLTIAIMVTSIGHVSGGHLNPAVSLALAATNRMKWGDAAAYIVAQCAGAIAGAAVIKGAFDDRWKEASAQVALGEGVSLGQGVLLEALATFFLVWVVFATAVDRDGAFFKVAGLPIGFAVTVDILMVGGLTGATMNPARWLGPNVITGDFSDALAWIIGPAIGALVAGFAYMYGIRPRLPEDA
jgi:aquaporin TIP